MQNVKTMLLSGIFEPFSFSFCHLSLNSFFFQQFLIMENIKIAQLVKSYKGFFTHLILIKFLLLTLGQKLFLEDTKVGTGKL